MKKTSDVIQICDILRETYPHVKTQLLHRNPFELLISTILSAQCTDRQVNAVTPNLFRSFPTPDALAAAPVSEIENLIRPTGFFHNKARHIRNCAGELVRRFDGEVPERLDDLVTLPGVGRKTANVVLTAAFGQSAVVVDTHVKRISFRLGLTGQKDPTQIEMELMDVIPEPEWNHFGLRLIYLGREICQARNPRCGICPLRPLCEFGTSAASDSAQRLSGTPNK